MTPDEMRRAAELLEEAALLVRMSHQQYVELPNHALAAALRAEAEAKERGEGER